MCTVYSINIVYIQYIYMIYTFIYSSIYLHARFIVAGSARISSKSYLWFLLVCFTESESDLFLFSYVNANHAQMLFGWQIVGQWWTARLPGVELFSSGSTAFMADRECTRCSMHPYSRWSRTFSDRCISASNAIRKRSFVPVVLLTLHAYCFVFLLCEDSKLELMSFLLMCSTE